MLILALLGFQTSRAANKYDNPDTLIVARDGSGEFRNVNDAIEVCRAFMSYHKVIFVKKGTYKKGKTLTAKVSVKASESAKYRALTKTVTVKIKVK